MNTTRESVIQAAHNTGHELTDNQVQSILIRREQLIKESRNLTNIKRQQIDWCWRWWYNEESD